jgi:plasmid stabilization system protein ParE
MSYSAVLSERALRELLESWKWYEDRQDGLGDRFTQLVFAKIEEIQHDPGKGIVRQRNWYEARIKIFPFLLIYKIDKRKKQVFISSIFHTSRNPKIKYRK